MKKQFAQTRTPSVFSEKPSIIALLEKVSAKDDGFLGLPRERRCIFGGIP
ncbi:hypothetical protein N9F12_01805 [Burkholderiaceae bacterium]|nr:hypothetical protein [Burkholderiaceae bacterium]